MYSIESPVIVSVTGIWIGFVLAISFMEAWLKFRAPGVTRQIGLGIGKLVFTALNRVELVCCTLLFSTIAIVGLWSNDAINTPFYLATIILLIQTFYYLPALNKRAEQIIAGGNIAKSHHHTVYAVLELIKLVMLTSYLLMQFTELN